MRPDPPAGTSPRAPISSSVGLRAREPEGAPGRAAARENAPARPSTSLCRASGSSAMRELGLAQPPDLVAEPRRLLEFEVAGGVQHALLQVGHVRLEIVADHALVGEAGVDAHVVALVDGVEDVADRRASPIPA